MWHGIIPGAGFSYFKVACTSSFSSLRSRFFFTNSKLAMKLVRTIPPKPAPPPKLTVDCDTPKYDTWHTCTTTRASSFLSFARFCGVLCEQGCEAREHHVHLEGRHVGDQADGFWAGHASLRGIGNSKGRQPRRHARVSHHLASNRLRSTVERGST